MPELHLSAGQEEQLGGAASQSPVVALQVSVTGAVEPGAVSKPLWHATSQEPPNGTAEQFPSTRRKVRDIAPGGAGCVVQSASGRQKALATATTLVAPRRRSRA